MTNADEREYLDGLVDSGVLGTHAISCAYVELLPEGSGLEVTAENVKLVHAGDVCQRVGHGRHHGRAGKGGGALRRLRHRGADGRLPGL